MALCPSGRTKAPSSPAPEPSCRPVAASSHLWGSRFPPRARDPSVTPDLGPRLKPRTVGMSLQTVQGRSEVGGLPAPEADTFPFGENRWGGGLA